MYDHDREKNQQKSHNIGPTVCSRCFVMKDYSLLVSDTMQCGSGVPALPRNLQPSSSTVKMEAVDFSEMLVQIYQSTRRHIPEDRNLDATVIT
jgi:hypothetical protein